MIGPLPNTAGQNNPVQSSVQAGNQQTLSHSRDIDDVRPQDNEIQPQGTAVGSSNSSEGDDALTNNGGNSFSSDSATKNIANLSEQKGDDDRTRGGIIDIAV